MDSSESAVDSNESVDSSESYYRLQSNESKQCGDILPSSTESVHFIPVHQKIQFGSAAVLCRSEKKGWQWDGEHGNEGGED